ncbi:MAG: GNAT family N-acetyltransferase [Acidobacteriota bacterium]|nr:GNAT family N-acetyltransferase [Acidobacteriota bacterium]
MKPETSEALEMSIVPVTSRALLRRFVFFPYRLYRRNPFWVPQLRTDEWRFHLPRYNPFLQRNPVQFFLAFRGDRLVGRIAAIINRDHDRAHGAGTGFFGRFECVNDLGVARALVHAAAQWVKRHGARRMLGPTDFSTNNVSGLLDQGFSEPPRILMPYNPEYYLDLLHQCGFRPAMRFFAYEVDSATIRFPKIVDRLEQRLARQGIAFRYPDYSRVEAESAVVVDLFNRSWADNWGFVPLEKNEMIEDFKRVKPFAHRDLIMLAEKDGEAVGFSLALPDVYQALRGLNGRLFPVNWLRLLRRVKKIDAIRVLLMGVVPEYRQRGIDLVFYRRTMINAISHNIHKAELSWILESNGPMNSVLQHINARITKSYRIVELPLD